jgi:hypothetical protein
MRVTLDPISALVAALFVSGVLYASHRTISSSETDTEVDTVYCVGACALIKGNHKRVDSDEVHGEE